MKAGWETRRLGEVCRVVGGGTPSKARADYYGGDIPWATIRDLSVDEISSTEHSITKAAVRESATNVIPAGSIVVASRVGLGKSARLLQDTAINQDIRALLPIRANQLDSDFLFWLMKFLGPRFVAAGRGATVQGVTLPFIKGLELPIPPLAEQRRIVEVLAEAFAALATATANTEQTLANARELFESELASIVARAQSENPSRPLNEECLQITVGHVGPMKERYVDQGIPFLRSQNVRAFRMDLENVLHIDEAFDGELTKSRLRAGDVAVVRTGYPGTAAVIPDTLTQANCADLVIIRPGANLNPTSSLLC